MCVDPCATTVAAEARDMPSCPRARFRLDKVEMFSADETLLAGELAFVDVAAVNDPPAVTAPPFDVVVDEDAGWIPIPGVFVTDPDVHEDPHGTIEVSCLLISER